MTTKVAVVAAAGMGLFVSWTPLGAVAAAADAPAVASASDGARWGEWREQRYEDVDLSGEGDAPEHTQPQREDPEPALEPYGHWYDDRDWGHVWRPQVSSSWLPYADGSWASSSWGWAWVSSEPWAWTFHYGRWTWTDAYGWVWVPGTTWGPAWVSWFWADGYVGWTPSPLGQSDFDRFVLVHERDFTASHIRTIAVSPRNIPRRVREGWMDGGPSLRRAPDVEQMARLGTQPLKRLSTKPVAMLAPWDPEREEARRAAPVEAAAAVAPSHAWHPARSSAPGWVNASPRDGSSWSHTSAPPPVR